MDDWMDVEADVGEVAEDPPLPWFGRHSLVAVFDGAVWQNAMISPNVDQFVGAAGVLDEELLRQRLGRCAVSAAGVG